VLERVDRDLGAAATATAEGVAVDATSLAGGAGEPARLGWAVAHWAVALAGPLGLAEVRVADHVWQRGPDVWERDAQPTPLPPGSVLLVLSTG
ncbi:MAG TPA: hypothetical protein PKB06_08310, partial [Actinotalea sp.]|nr:hypothetical protein [Actinotalea sp.]